MARFISKRNLFGTILFLILVGEPVVGLITKLYTVIGLMVFICLYALLFLLYEALTIKYSLSYAALLPLTFGIYSVFITGLLHGELTEYALSPRNNLGTSLIRLQCSFYPIFAYYVLNKKTVRDTTKVPKLRSILTVFSLFILLLTPSKTFGLITLARTFQTAPFISVIFSLLGLLSVFFALSLKYRSTKIFNSKVFTLISLMLLMLCLIPNLKTFTLVLLFMPLIGLLYFIKSDLKHTKF